MFCFVVPSISTFKVLSSLFQGLFHTIAYTVINALTRKERVQAYNIDKQGLSRGLCIHYM